MKKLLYTGTLLLLSAGFMASCSYKTCPAYSGSRPYYSYEAAPAPSPTAPTATAHATDESAR